MVAGRPERRLNGAPEQTEPYNRPTRFLAPSAELTASWPVRRSLYELGAPRDGLRPRSGDLQTHPPTVAPMKIVRYTPLLAALAFAAVLAAIPAAARADNPPPGDIPDNQAFVVYAGTGYSLKVPDGWARRVSGQSVTFADKYNAIRVVLTPAARAPSVASVKSAEIPKLKVRVKGFTNPRVSAVSRTVGTAILVTYRATSAPNAVTGKTITNDVQRYEFWRRGKLLVLTLQAPVGSDNVDVYRLVTNSLRWG